MIFRMAGKRQAKTNEPMMHMVPASCTTWATPR